MSYILLLKVNDDSTFIACIFHSSQDCARPV